MVARFGQDSFVFDVYIETGGRVWLLDLNPWGLMTDALLFSWLELGAVNASEQVWNRALAVKYATEAGIAAPTAGDQARGNADDDEPLPVVRVIDSNRAVRPGLAMTSRLPKDLQMFRELSGMLQDEDGIAAFVDRARDGSLPA